MDVRIRHYEATDRPALEALMVELQKHLVAIDPLGRLRLEPGYGQAYVNDLLCRIDQQEGVILIAEENGQVLGCCACIVERQRALELLGEKPLMDGRVIELVVVPSQRGKGIGSQLMQSAEAYLREKGCDSMRVEVFAPNATARRLYEKLGYAERMVDMLKVL